MHGVAIAEFTGNLGQLEADAGDIAFDGMAVGAAGLLIDADFRLLEPFYKAPEADQLFATTAPVAAAGHDLQTELATVSKALLDYAAEVRPLVGRLDSLRAEAAASLSAFRSGFLPVLPVRSSRLFFPAVPLPGLPASGVCRGPGLGEEFVRGDRGE
ncbi:hypothetical protein [Streptomyces griseiscabiei]|uniref:Uncharacterized protein n=1 Tax=Streptomyces griseiscabiei TaxID=2993540 RepID=A0ABU4LHH5_9ACTN|nr:hypothetical protein [Streptomyces griseiscabiei]MDX2915184.1 hypothetical protein [Streptomyces griseiscabiei]